MQRLDNSATVEDVDAVLGTAKRLTARDVTTVLKDLKTRKAWATTLRVGEWLRQRSRQGAATATGEPSAAPPQPLPNRAHYQVMLSACAASGKAAEAEGLRAQMAAEGVPIDGTVLSTLVFACERARQPARTVLLLDELEELAEGPSSPHDAESAAAPTPRAATAVDPRTFAYASAIRAHEGAGDWEGALALFERLEARSVAADAHCYCAALGACRRGGQAERALALMAKVASEGRVAPNRVMYTLAMAACNAGKQWESSLRLFDERMATLGGGGSGGDASTEAADPYSYSVAMGACAQGKQWERALALLDEMEADPACAGNAFAWNHAMVACTRGGQHAQALALYDRMRDGAAELTEHSVAAALLACRGAEGTDAAWMRAQAIYDGHPGLTRASDMCQTALLDVLADAEEWPLLLEYFDSIKARAEHAPTPKAYERAIEACDRVDSGRSLALFAELKAQLAATGA